MTNTIQILSITSRFTLAAAIVYLGYQFARGIDSLPEIDQWLTQVTQQVPPTLDAIEKARIEMAAVRKQIPFILEEVAQVRLSLPPVIDEVVETRRQLPSLLERVDKTVAVVGETQRQIPRILQTVDRATVTIDKTRTQIEALTPQVLSEIRLTREIIDPTLDRVDGLINDVSIMAKDAGQEASEGAIGGIFTGILKLPFRLIGSLASPLLNSLEPDITRQLTLQDIELMSDAGKRTSDLGKLNKPQHWKNAASGNAGSITLVRRFQLEESDCVEARITIDISGERTLDELESFCRKPDGEWISAPIPSN